MAKEQEYDFLPPHDRCDRCHSEKSVDEILHVEKQLTELIEVSSMPIYPTSQTNTSIIIIIPTIIADHDDQATYSTETSKLQEILETGTDQLHPTHFLVINIIMLVMLVSLIFIIDFIGHLAHLPHLSGCRDG